LIKVTVYLSIIALVTLILGQQDPHERAQKENSMGWTELTPIDVNAKPAGTWTWAYEWIEGPALIKFEATGTWQYSQASPACSPDGDLNSLISARYGLMADAPVGALVAKVGGSTAGAKDGKVYLVGSKAVVPLDQSTSGPLFLSINDDLTGMSDNSGAVNVRIWVKKLPVPAAGAAGGQAPAPPQQGGAQPPPAPQPPPTPGAGAAPGLPIPGPPK
jgi:hypothetical protein